jgi:hypothetical protein
MGSVSLVLNTRHGTVHNPKDFGSCKWTLADPIYAPPNYNLYAELTFMTITNDQERINAKLRVGINKKIGVSIVFDVGFSRIDCF